MEANETYRLYCLTEEAFLSRHLVEAGLREWARANEDSLPLHAAMVLLSSGLERTLKVVKGFAVYTLEERLPTKADIPNSHSIRRLLDDIVPLVFVEDYISDPKAEADRDFLTSDAHVNHVVDTLSEFGGSARYYNMSIARGEEWLGPSPEESWWQVEWEALKEPGPSTRELVDGRMAVEEAAVVVSGVMGAIGRAVCFSPALRSEVGAARAFLPFLNSRGAGAP